MSWHDISQDLNNLKSLDDFSNMDYRYFRMSHNRPYSEVKLIELRFWVNAGVQASVPHSFHHVPG